MSTIIIPEVVNAATKPDFKPRSFKLPASQVKSIEALVLKAKIRAESADYHAKRARHEVAECLAHIELAIDEARDAGLTDVAADLSRFYDEVETIDRAMTV